MRHNMGNIERFLRMLIGVVVLLFSSILGPILGYPDAFNFVWGNTSSLSIGYFVLFLIGLAMTLTGIFAYCPINELAHVNSCKACKVGETHAHQPV